ncbi:MAG: radical SAM protein [Candidatus Omnitrophica bacterium]|nr:radical SAM protein [Candidatus Omnitrophota bacterium]
MEERNTGNLYERLRKTNIALRMQIDCTYRCNLKCVHCFQSKRIDKELTFARWHEILIQLKEHGCLEIIFSGGEPFIREDFLEILMDASDMGFAIKINTNGTLLKENDVAQLRKVRLTFIQVSLYGVLAATHDLLTAQQGTFEKVMQAIGWLEKHKVKFRIAFLVTKHNVNELASFRRVARERKWPVIYDLIIYPTSDGETFPLAHRISDAQIEQVASDPLFKNNIVSRVLLKPALSDFGSSVGYISPYGEIYSSANVRILCGDLTRDSFSDIWSNSAYLKKLRSLKLEDFECSRCDCFLRCLMCEPTLAYLEHGDLLAIPQEACRFTKKVMAMRKEECAVQ